MDPVAIVTTEITKLEGYATGVAPEALGIAVALFGLGFAWKLVRKFAK